MGVGANTLRSRIAACEETFSITYNPFLELPEESIYQKMQKLCALNDTTIKDAANKAGLSYSVISKYNKVANPDPVNLHKFASVFGLDIKYFIPLDMSKLSDKIFYHRVINGYSITRLAKILGVLRCTVSDWEKGKSMPSNQNLHRLKDIFNKDFGYTNKG